MKMHFRALFLLAVVGILCANAGADLVYELKFQDVGGAATLANTGTVGGVAVQVGVVSSYTTDAPANGGEYARDLTRAGTDMTWPADGPGLALPSSTTRFDMTTAGDTMTIATSIFLNPSASGHYSRPSDGYNFWRGIANNRGTGGTGGWFFGINNNYLYFGMTGGVLKNSGLTLTENAWYHVAVTWTAGGNMTMYLNGVAASVGTVAPCSDSSGNNITAGLNDGGSYWPLNGKMDNFQIYNTILTQSEIGALVSSDSGPMTFSWSLAGNGNWDTSTNWTPNGVPGGFSNNDVVKFQRVGADWQTWSVTLDTTRTVASVLINSGYQNYNILGTGTLNVTGDFYHQLAWGANYIQPVVNIGGLYKTDPTKIDMRTIIKFGNSTSYTNGNTFAGGIFNASETLDIGGNNNTFGGSITVQGFTTMPWTTNPGIIKISGSGNTYAAMPINLNLGGTFRPTNQDLSNITAFNFRGGQLRLDGGGNTLPTLANGLEVAQGSIFINANANLGANDLTLGGPNTFGYLRGSASDLARQITLAGQGGAIYGTAWAVNADFTITSLITGPGMLMKLGEKTATLSGAVPNDYEGGTTVAGGTLNVGAASSLGTGNVRILPRAALGLNAATNVDAAASVLLDSAPAAFGQLRVKADVAVPTIDAASTGTILLDSNLSQNITSIGSAFLGTESNKTYSGTSLAVGTGNTYRIGGTMPPVAGGDWHHMVAISNAVLTGDNNLLISYGGAWLNNANTFTGTTTINHMIAPWGAADIWLQVSTWWSGSQTWGSTTGDVNMMGGQMRSYAQWGEGSITKGDLTVSSNNLIGAGHYWAQNNFSLVFASLTRNDRGAVQLWNPEVEDFGVANSQSKTVKITITSAPTVTNGIVAPWITMSRGLNGVNDFATYGNSTFSTAAYSQTVAAGAFPTGLVAGTDVIATTGNVTLGDSPIIYALRANGTVSGAGSTVTLGSGGLIFNAAGTSNANFKAGADGTGELMLYTNYAVTLSGSITANGLTKSGTAGALTLTGSNPGLTGKVTINGGYITATDASLGSANIVLNGGGLNCAGGMTKTVYIGPAGGAQMYYNVWPMAPLADETPGQSGPFVLYTAAETNKNNDAFTGAMIVYGGNLRLDGAGSPGMGPVVIYPELNVTTYGAGWNNQSRWTLMGGSTTNGTNVVLSQEGQSAAQTFKFGSIVGSGNISFGQYGYNLPYVGSGLSVGWDNTDADYYGAIYEVTAAAATNGYKVTKVGTGTWTLWGDHSWHGATTVNGGTLAINGGLYNGGYAGTAVTVNNTGTLSGTGTVERAVVVNTGGTLAGSLHIVGGVEVYGGVGNPSGAIIDGNLTLDTGSYGGSSTVNGMTSNYGGVISGSHTFNGDVELDSLDAPAELTGTNTINGSLNIGSWGDAATVSGQTTVNKAGGYVYVYGSMTGVNNINVGTGGVWVNPYQGLDASTFGGTGTVTAAVLGVNAGNATISGNMTINAPVALNAGTFKGGHTVNGDLTAAADSNAIIAPSNTLTAAETLTVVGNVTLDSTTTLNFNLGAPGTIGAGVNDLIDITGGLTLDGTLNVNALTGFGAGTYDLFSYTGSLTDNELLVGTMPDPQYGYEITAGSGKVSLVVSAAFVPGDTNRDTFVNSLDIDAIYQNFGDVPPMLVQYDVNGDGVVDQADVTEWLTSSTIVHDTCGVTNYGDANLDAFTDFTDFQALLDHWQGNGGWAEADFTGNGFVDFEDFQVLLDYWNPTGWSDSQGQVPEPASLSLLALGALALLKRGRRS